MIRVIALCVFRHGDRILVSEAVDKVTHDRYARPLGGGVDMGELTADAVVREIREETGHETNSLRFLGVLENIFTCDGKAGHEIVFVYDGVFADSAVYDRPNVPIVEAGWPSPAVWRSLDSFDAGCRLVPKGLADLLRKSSREISPAGS